MDKTTYRITHEDQEVHISFDLRDQENCFIELSFSREDVLNIINMRPLQKNKIELVAIKGVASLVGRNADDLQICFNYRNCSAVESGIVCYSYNKLSALLNEVFTKLNSQ